MCKNLLLLLLLIMSQLLQDVIDADLSSPLSTNDEATIRYRRMLAAGNYQQQCNAHQPCPSGWLKYCFHGCISFIVDLRITCKRI